MQENKSSSRPASRITSSNYTENKTTVPTSFETHKPSRSFRGTGSGLLEKLNDTFLNEFREK